MITGPVKAMAIAKMKCQVPLETIMEELEIPMPLLKEWEAKLDDKDLIQLKANVLATQRLAAGDIEITSSMSQETLIKAKIEEVALEIVDQVSLTVMTGDIVRAKALQLCADTVTKIYSALISKAGAGGELKPNGREITAFQSIMKD